MNSLILVSLFLVSISILTSVSIIGVYQILVFIPAIYFLYVWVTEKKKCYFTKSSIFLAIFLICAAISLIVNLDDIKAPLKSFGKLKFLFYALAQIPLLYYWIPRAKVVHKKILIHAFFLSIVVAGSVALYQYIISGGGRSEGLIGIMRYGYASSMISILMIGLLLNFKKLKLDFNFKFGLIALGFSIAGIFLTQTRGALAGFICALPFVLYFFRPKLGLIFGAVSTTLISILAFAYLFGSGNYGSRYLKSQNDLGDVVRQEQWKSAIIATKEHPLFGWGFNNFYSQVERIKKENNFKTAFYINEHSHNVFLEIAAGTGLIGFLFFILWIIFWAYECFMLENSLRALFVPFGVCFVISGQFEVILDTNNSTLIFLIYSLSQVAVIYSKDPLKKLPTE